MLLIRLLLREGDGEEDDEDKPALEAHTKNREAGGNKVWSCGLQTVEGSRESRVGGGFFRSEKPEWRSERAVRPKEA